jgi:extracellular factor (EF) 3-hydroxypalmitic acid methyl ester biosynthesis protein
MSPLLHLPHPDWSTPRQRPVDWLDGVLAEMEVADDIDTQMERLVRGLRAFRQEWTWEEWQFFCRTTAANHGLRDLIHECPFTSHGFSRPRGYPGDAELIDYLYAEDACPQERLGSAIYRYIHRLPCAQSVRERRDLLAARIDALASTRKQPDILSVACGHLREAERSVALASGQVGSLTALDQDARSLELISKWHAGTAVRPVKGSVRHLVTGRAHLPPQDFIYSAGLYDYLSAPVARRLTRQLFELLKPGGTVLVANFAPYPLETGYVEAFMNWWLIYRDEEQVEGLASEIDPSQIARREMFRDSTRNVIYFGLTRT